MISSSSTRPRAGQAAVGFSVSHPPRERLGADPAATYSKPPFVQPHDAVHLGREALVVGGDQGGAAFAAHEVEEFGEDDVGGRLVEIAGRLVGEHQRRAVGERPGDRDALLLAARQLRRAMVEPLAEPSAASSCSARVRAASGVGAADQLRQDDILAARRTRAADGGTDRRSRAARGAAAVRPSSSRFAASSPASRIEPSNPPSSSPTACSRVDLPEPDGPSNATISPGATSRSTPRSTSIVTSPWVKLRLRPAGRSRTGLHS